MTSSASAGTPRCGQAGGDEGGIYPDQNEFAKTWALDRLFSGQVPDDQRDLKYQGWKDAVARTLSK
ncbi:MAG: hypothetical protein GY952_02985 [Rhodobacteraceae bacterium]|nr:hypothetical protein [Paracoccaceae bacterium]